MIVDPFKATEFVANADLSCLWDTQFLVPGS